MRRHHVAGGRRLMLDRGNRLRDDRFWSPSLTTEEEIAAQIAEDQVKAMCAVAATRR